MASLDEQIEMLAAAERVLFSLSDALDRAGLTGPMESTLRASLHAGNECHRLKRQRGNADDVIEEATFERLWRDVMARVTREGQGAGLDGEGTP